VKSCKNNPKPRRHKNPSPTKHKAELLSTQPRSTVMVMIKTTTVHYGKQ